MSKNLIETEPEPREDAAGSGKVAVTKKDSPSKARKFIASAIGQPDDEGWVNLALVGTRIQGARPDFDPRSFGCANLSALVEKSGGFDIRKEGGVVYVRRRVAARKGSGAGKKAAA